MFLVSSLVTVYTGSIARRQVKKEIKGIERIWRCSGRKMVRELHMTETEKRSKDIYIKVRFSTAKELFSLVESGELSNLAFCVGNSFVIKHSVNKQMVRFTCFKIWTFRWPPQLKNRPWMWWLFDLPWKQSAVVNQKWLKIASFCALC